MPRSDNATTFSQPSIAQTSRGLLFTALFMDLCLIYNSVRESVKKTPTFADFFGNLFIYLFSCRFTGFKENFLYSEKLAISYAISRVNLVLCFLFNTDDFFGFFPGSVCRSAWQRAAAAVATCKTGSCPAALRPGARYDRRVQAEGAISNEHSLSELRVTGTAYHHRVDSYFLHITMHTC